MTVPRKRPAVSLTGRPRPFNWIDLSLVLGAAAVLFGPLLYLALTSINW